MKRLLTCIFLLAPLGLAQEPGSGAAPADSPGPERPWIVGEVRARLPELPEVGQVFEVVITAETGPSILAALTLRLGWDPDVLALESILGGLRLGATTPFVSNTRKPGELIISDINVPQVKGSGPTYNMAMQGRARLYTVVFRRVGEGSPALCGEVSAFHDPGDSGPRGQPRAIGGAPFPRRILIEGPGLATREPPPPQGEVWLRQPDNPPPRGELLEVSIRAQLGDQPIGSFSLLVRHDPAHLHLVSGRTGAGQPLPVSSLRGQVWISGTGDTPGPADEQGQAVLCTLTFRRLTESPPPALAGTVVSLHTPADADGSARPIGALPLPRAIHLR